MLDRHGNEVRKGDWLRDVNGICEVRDIDVGESRLTRVLEVLLFDNDEYYVLGDERWLTRYEIRHMERM